MSTLDRKWTEAQLSLLLDGRRRSPAAVAATPRPLAPKVSEYDRAQDDWYVELPWHVEILLKAEAAHGGLPGLCWDPACGGGNIPRTLRAHGIACEGSDLRDRGFGTAGVDFLAPEAPLPFGPVDNIVSNPPFDVMKAWAFRALWLARRKVALLGRLNFLEAIDRDDLLGAGPGDHPAPLARVWVSRRRVNMPPGGTGVRPTGGRHAYAWFVFAHGHVGPATIGRV
jgi:hypothetical protein